MKFHCYFCHHFLVALHFLRLFGIGFQNCAHSPLSLSPLSHLEHYTGV